MKPSVLWNRWTLFLAGVLLVRLTVTNEVDYSFLNLIGIHTILVVGLNLLMGYAGQISLGHAGFFALGAFSSAILTVTYGVNPWLAMLLGLVISGLIAFLIGLPTLKLRGYYLAMATLGFGYIVYEVLKATLGSSGISYIPRLSLAGHVLQTHQSNFLLIWSLVALALVLSANLVDSRVGRGLRALHDSEAAAQSLGVNTARLKLTIFIWSALYASLAGSLFAHVPNRTIAPASFDFMFSVKLVAMVVMGGMASIWGSLLGAGVFTLLDERLLASFQDYKMVTFGAILMLIMIFLPRGLVRGLLDLWEFRRFKKKGGSLPV